MAERRKKAENDDSQQDREEAAAPPTKEEEPPSEVYFLGMASFPSILLTIAAWVVRLVIIAWACKNAYRIRTFAIQEYGKVIHEFDPWFNFRATQYLNKHGWEKFFHWFDYMVWYPLGRPVGTTIYPGMQITAVVIFRVLKLLGKPYRMSLNDVCCFMPCWFGSLATVLLALLTWETSGSANAATIGAVIFAIIPAHIMRSVGGGYDNESIAVSAMVLSFWLWTKACKSTWPILMGTLTGLAYGYMVAAWGGYVFVLNMIGCHAGVILVMDWVAGRFSHRLHWSYTAFYAVGTLIATRVPVVSMTPLRSLEQMAPCALFVLMQALWIAERMRLKHGATIWSIQGVAIRVRVLGTMALVLGVVVAMVWPTGYFGPLSSRIRGLFVKHTRTGNPLVDSVAEHQPASKDAYWQYLHVCCYYAPVGLFMMILVGFTGKLWRSATFIVTYGFVAYFFSTKMARLIILAGPVSSALAAICLGYTLDWMVNQLWWSGGLAGIFTSRYSTNLSFGRKNLGRAFCRMYNAASVHRMRLILAGCMLFLALGTTQFKEFSEHSEQLAHAFSNPQIMYKAHLRNGREIIVDDYRKAYFWLKENTAADARVMAWWDYGYQITGIANRTSIADGNTWNHEHIATLGKCLVSPVKEAHSLIRHLADYVLVWAGGGGDDIAKSPHMARISNSVYRDVCPGDPTCALFGFDRNQQPTTMMRNSLLYNLVSYQPGASSLDTSLFEEVYTSPYHKVKIFRVNNISPKSKKWVADPANRICDAPGSWYCTGQYPPAKVLKNLFKKKRAFKQLEDFNKGGADMEYHKEYMKRMGSR